MTNSDSRDLTFAVLLSRLGFTSLAANEGAKSQLEEEFDLLRDISLIDLTDEYLSMSVRQNVFVDHIVPIIIERLEEDPLRGFGYDGELFASLGQVRNEYWIEHPEPVAKMRRISDRLAHLEVFGETYDELKIVIRQTEIAKSE